MTVFIELSTIIVIATLIAFLMKALKQPLIVGYIATGVLVGPYFLNILHSKEEIELFSKIGISILLFIVGLGLNPEVVKEVGKTSLITGLGQVIFTSVIGYFIMLAMGFSHVASIYTAIALTFSSTIIILKLLTDRGDTGKLYGRISIGFLLVQDIVATIILLAVSIFGTTSFAGGSNIFQTLGSEFGLLVLKGLVLVIIIYTFSKYFLGKISEYIAGNQEVLFIFSLAWGLGLASLFQYIGFSIEIGALIAGVTLAVSPFAYEIGSRMKPLRDFFILLFFILLGAQMVLSQFTSLIIPAVVLSVFVLVGNPIIVFILMNLLGYKSRTSFMAGLTVAQISEFSLILVALGLSFGHISDSIASLVTLVGIITITGSTYLILYSDNIYQFCRKSLKLLEFRKSHLREKKTDNNNPEAIIFGYDRVGFDFVREIKKLSERYVVVDFNPQAIKRLKKNGTPFRYGDAEDAEFLDEVGVGGAKLIVSTIPDYKTNLLLLKFYRKSNHDGVIITISHDIDQAKILYEAGASYVVLPHILGANHASSLISSYGFDVVKFNQIKFDHLNHLEERKIMGV